MADAPDLFERTGGACLAPRCRRRCRYAERGQCTLVIAAEGSHTLDQIGAVLGVTREWVRQIEIAAIARLRTTLDDLQLDLDFVHAHGDPDPAPPLGYVELRRGVQRLERFARVPVTWKQPRSHTLTRRLQQVWQRDER